MRLLFLYDVRLLILTLPMRITRSAGHGGLTSGARCNFFYGRSAMAMRFWLLTSTFYGNRLPGDDRGFVGRVREKRDGELSLEHRIRHNKPGEVVDAAMPELEAAAGRLLKQAPIRVTAEQAVALMEQFQETAGKKAWSLLACAVMADHVHLVVGIDESWHGRKARQTFKAYGSRVLNDRWGKPVCETWWTEGGSDRVLRDEQAILDAIEYVQNQEFPLLIWKQKIRD